VPNAIPDPSLTSPCSPPSSYFHHIQPPPPSQLFCQTNAGNYVTESISSPRGLQVRWAIFVISKKRRKKKKKEENQPEWPFTYLPQSSPNPHPPPPSLNNLQYPHREKTHIAYIDNLKQPYERATAGLSSQAVVYLIFFKTVLSKFEIPLKKSQKKNQVRADDEQRVTMYLVIGMICYGILGQPGAGDRVG